MCISLDNLSKKLQLKFQVNPTKIERVLLYSIYYMKYSKYRLANFIYLYSAILELYN